MTSERSIPHLRDIFGLGVQSFHQYSEIGYQQKDAFDAEAKKKRSKRSKSRDNYKTLTNGDVKTLERHLSMKKTIRKKIMRDLSQAFVEDPSEFKIENSTPEQLKAELSAEAMKFGEKHNRKSGADSNFLDMLRGDAKTGKSAPREDGEYAALNRGEPDDEDKQGSNDKTSFWRRFTMKNKNKR